MVNDVFYPLVVYFGDRLVGANTKGSKRNAVIANVANNKNWDSLFACMLNLKDSANGKRIAHQNRHYKVCLLNDLQIGPMYKLVSSRAASPRFGRVVNPNAVEPLEVFLDLMPMLIYGRIGIEVDRTG
jgi:hypothetical protein